MSSKTHYFKQSEFRSAFTMVELVFVIVVLGILAAVAIPKLAVSRDDAVMVKGKSQVAAIRSGISLLRSQRLLEGNTTAISSLDNNASTSEGQTLFYGATAGNILEYPLISKNSDGNWMKTGANTYNFIIGGQAIPFTYNATTGFTCDTTNASTGANCKALTQ